MEELEEETVPEDDAELTLSKVDEEFVVSMELSCLQPLPPFASPDSPTPFFWNVFLIVSKLSAIVSPLGLCLS